MSSSHDDSTIEYPIYKLNRDKDGKIVSLKRTIVNAPKRTESKDADLKNNEPKHFCMFCKKAGRPFDHLMKKDNNPEGEIICEYLLSIKCEHCKDFGHTKSYCPYYDKSKYKLLSNGEKYIYVDKSNESIGSLSGLSNSKSNNNKSFSKSFDESDEELVDSNNFTNKFCQFCEKNNVPKNICNSHDTFTYSNGNVLLSCPLFYYLNNVKNNDSVLEKPKLSEEPDITPKKNIKSLNIKDSPFVPFILKKEKCSDSFNKLSSSIESISSNASSFARDSLDSADLNNMINNLECLNLNDNENEDKDEYVDEDVNNYDNGSIISNSVNSSLNNSFDDSINDFNTDNETNNSFNSNDLNQSTNLNYHYKNTYNPQYPNPNQHPNLNPNPNPNPNSNSNSNLYPYPYQYPNYSQFPQYSYPNGYYYSPYSPYSSYSSYVQPITIPSPMPSQNNVAQTNNLSQSNNLNVIKTRTVTSTYYSPCPSPSAIGLNGSVNSIGSIGSIVANSSTSV